MDVNFKYFKTLFSRPNFLIFDEPTNHLDVETVGALAKAFKKFKVTSVEVLRHVLVQSSFVLENKRTF